MIKLLGKIIYIFSKFTINSKNYSLSCTTAFNIKLLSFMFVVPKIQWQ